jgi:hypothetical protein
MNTVIVGGVTVTITDTEVNYEAGAEVDADGAPTAYALPGSGLIGLDNIRNALRNIHDDPNNPSHGWAGVLVGPDGKPVIQQDGPGKGYCISTTALHDPSMPVNDIRRYVPADSIAYISISPVLEQYGVKLGDGALVYDVDTGKQIEAVVGDVGPYRRLGEVSVYCAQACGFNSSPRNGGVSRGIRVRIFLGSAADPAWDYRRSQTDVTALVNDIVNPAPTAA